MFKRRRPDPEKNTYSAVKCTPLEQYGSHWVQNVANSKNFHPRENRIYLHFEALGAAEYVCNIKYKITVDKFRSCTSHKQ